MEHNIMGVETKFCQKMLGPSSARLTLKNNQT